MLRHITLTALLLAFAPLSQAADNGIYIGAGYAQSDYGLDNPLNAPEFDDEDGGFKVIAGFRPLDHFSVELNYIDHGDATVPVGVADTTRHSAETISGFAVGYIPLPLVDLFAKVGGAAWNLDSRTTVQQPTFDLDDSDFDFAWGAGVQVHFWSLAARLEYEQFKIINDEELGTVSLSFIYTFL